MKYANTCVKEILFDLSISLVVSIQLPASLVLPATIYSISYSSSVNVQVSFFCHPLEKTEN